MVGKLKRMAASDNNQEYLDQIYYAIGNIYLAQKDTLQAIGAYEKGVAKATRSGIEKGVLLLHLGDIYWIREKFSDAQRCYGEAIGLLDKERKDYEQLSNRISSAPCAKATTVLLTRCQLSTFSRFPQSFWNCALPWLTAIGE